MSTPLEPPTPPSSDDPERKQSRGEVYATVEGDKGHFGVQHPNGQKHIVEMPTNLLRALGQAIAQAFAEAGEPPAHAGDAFCASALRALLAQNGGSTVIGKEFLTLPLDAMQILALPGYDGASFTLYLNPGAQPT